jgi:DNA-binding FrmR family transcriptional regulator
MALSIKSQARLKIINRISRLDGQVQGLRRMLEKPGDWKKLMNLSAAIQGAADQVAVDLFREYLVSLTGDEAMAGKAREGLELLVKRR